MLRLANLDRRYDAVVALDDLTFDAPRGAVLGLLGPNGAGKTTAMRAVMGVTEVEGSITWDGRPITAADRRGFGYMPEERGLYPKMRLRQQLLFFARLHGLDPDAARSATDHWLDRLELDDRGRDRVEELSHGNQQRAQLAVALVHDPELVILDEPFSGLDPLGVDALGALMLEQSRRGASVIFSSHQLDLVEQYCEQVVIVAQGTVVLAGAVEELGRDPGQQQLRVEVAGAGADWTSALRGVVVVATDARGVTLRLEPGTDPDRVLDAARAAGTVTRFSIERPSLSELFRAAVGQ